MSQPSSPRVHLALDTASPTTSIAVGASSQTAVERVLPLRRSGERLIPTVAELLDEQGLKTSDLASVIVLRGPGSFTGLRVGLATALGLHQALAMPIAIPSTMTVLAASTPAACVPAVGTPDNQTITAVVDALRGFWSAQRFTRHASDPLPRPIDAEPELLDAATLVARGDRLLVGFDTTALAEHDGWPSDTVFHQPPALATVALDLADHPDLPRDPDLLTQPLYFRPPAVTLPKSKS